MAVSRLARMLRLSLCGLAVCGAASFAAAEDDEGVVRVSSTPEVLVVRGQSPGCDVACDATCDATCDAACTGLSTGGGIKCADCRDGNCMRHGRRGRGAGLFGGRHSGGAGHGGVCQTAPGGYIVATGAPMGSGCGNQVFGNNPIAEHLRVQSMGYRMRNRMASQQLHAAMRQNCSEKFAWFRCKFGYFLPSGNGGTGSPLVGTYSMVYPLDPNYADGRDGSVYAAQGYNGPVSVPLAPVVHHAYNYGWGVPSSRLTPISHPVQ